ncbi:non-ribosomal peptide synthetase [Kitasatospora sp. NPDC056651]|uniref:non-ribosomal peptide synthetase n=1 Tax=Kitasatospora sp. NPDC056651 TaxID=3345892 RepID=UPI0036B31175
MTTAPHTRIEQRFTAVAEAFPERVALADRFGEIRYGELLAQARAAAASLRAEGVGSGTPVLIVGHGDRRTVLAMLAVLMAGGCYVPVDPRYPADRVRLMAATARAALALHAGDGADVGDGGDGPAVADLGVPVHDIPSLLTERTTAAAVPSSPAGPDDLACVMFTSGTTGVPKAVGVTHRGVTGLALGAESLRLGPGDGVLLHSTLAFDASTFEIWSPLLAGARITAADHHPLALHELAALLALPEVTTAWLTAPLFRLMATHHGPALGSLRTLVTGGDTVPADTARSFTAAHPATRLVNGYGPTENTTFSTLGDAAAWDREHSAAFPIGTAIAGTTCHVLDGRLRPVAPGAVGELFLGGPRLARGYLHDPAATAARFVPDPFSARPGARMYRTGDRVRHLPDGALDFLGRTDDEVKVRGFRTDPAEAAAVLAADPAVDDAVVITGTGPDGAVLTAFLTPASVDTDAVRRGASQRAPRHLVAERIIAVDALPLGPTGKVDRAALARLVDARTHDGHDADDPDDANPRTHADDPDPRAPDDAAPGHPALAAVWEAQTGHHPLPDSDFFADGGTSLGLMRLVEQVRTQLGPTLDFAQLYAAPTYADLCRLTAPSATPAPHGDRAQETVA